MFVHRTSSDRGQVSIEWAGVLLLVAIVVAAIFALGLPGRVAPQVEIAICKIFGGTDCERKAEAKNEPPPCIVHQFDGELGATVTVFSIKGGGKVKVTRKVDSSGKVTEIVTATPEAAIKLGLGARAGEGEKGGGEYGSAELGAKYSGQFGWEFPNQAKADEFHDILLGKIKDIGVASIPGGGIYQAITGDREKRSLPAPNLFGVEGGITGGVSGNYGPLKGAVSGDRVLGATHNTKTGETQVYMAANGEASASLLVGGTAKNETKIMVTFDKNHKPIRLNVITSAQGTAAPVLQGKKDLESIARSAVQETGKKYQVDYSLDLRDPALRDKVTDFIANPSKASASGLKDTVLQNSKVAVTNYDVTDTAVNPHADVGIEGVDFGFDAKAGGSEQNISDAYYWSPTSGGFKKWDSCLAGGRGRSGGGSW